MLSRSSVDPQRELRAQPRQRFLHAGQRSKKARHDTQVGRACESFQCGPAAERVQRSAKRCGKFPAPIRLDARVCYKKSRMDSNAKSEIVKLPVTGEVTTSGTLGIPEWWPSGRRVGVILAHDAPFDQEQPLLVRLQEQLVAKGYLTLRFNFPFAEAGKKRPDPPALLEKTLRAAISTMVRDPQNAPAHLVIGGSGLGCRVAAEAVAHGIKVDSLVCLGFPLHPSGKPSQQKADFLFRLICPILFVQGTRDPYCRVDRLQLLLRRIGTPTQLAIVEDADHSLQVIKRSPRTQAEVDAQVVSVLLEFLEATTPDR